MKLYAFDVWKDGEERNRKTVYGESKLEASRKLMTKYSGYNFFYKGISTGNERENYADKEEK